ncbi:uncharacterized protein BT62DRAFT_899005 [Guyanagaster necrorhizus]|uniref:RING-type domain-containing protein n=1 Tax=Guyanagaster necrorhizus TaxID=856835 RepID=A0A9P7VQC7_9AGAR|nr:uncharacterized protein BT62DRAFT_899005 [Guyanagaster necrorhizus MCA 3950]KAG7444657.1 hypothetical protein BT62DRAFT_899005 [Guyanagaster necrorhizus MCA 3950]
MLPRSRAASLAASSRSRSRASSRSGPPIPSVSPEPEQTASPAKQRPTKRRKKSTSNATPRKRRRKETVQEEDPSTGPNGVAVEELSTVPLVSPDVDQEPVAGPSELPPETTAEDNRESEPEPLSSYNCPICFTPPTNATLTPCGHICCGSCLFTAVKVAKRRAGLMMGGGELLAKCPVCRATIPGWDGRGGGVIGLKARTLFSVE